MKSYNIIFFQLYRSLLKAGANDFPVYTSVLLITLFITTNALTVLSIFRLIFQAELISISKYDFLIFYFVLLVLNLFYFFRNKKYGAIIETLKQANEKTKKRRMLFV